MTRDDVLAIVREELKVHAKVLHAHEPRLSPVQQEAVQKAFDALNERIRRIETGETILPTPNRRDCVTCAGPFDEERCIDCHDRGFSKWQPKTERRNCLGPQPAHHDGEPCLLPIYEGDKLQAQGRRFFYVGRDENPEKKWAVNDAGQIMFFFPGITLRNEHREILRAEPLPKCEECERWGTWHELGHMKRHTGYWCVLEADPRTCTPVPKVMSEPKPPVRERQIPVAGEPVEPMAGEPVEPWGEG